MKHNNKKQRVVNSKNVKKTMNVACTCIAVVSVLAPVVSVLGGISIASTKTIPSLIRVHIFF